MEMKLGGEKVHIKTYKSMWELLTLGAAVFHSFNQMEVKRPSKLREVDQCTDATFVTSPVCPALLPWRSGCLKPGQRGRHGFPASSSLAVLLLGIALGNVSVFRFGIFLY